MSIQIRLKRNQFCNMQKQIGQIIKDVLKNKGMAIAEFARRLNTSPQNVHSMFSRTSMDIDQLLKIGKILDHDFLQYYYKSSKNNLSEVNELQANYSNRNILKELADCQSAVNIFKKESEYFEELAISRKRTIELLEEKLRSNNIT